MSGLVQAAQIAASVTAILACFTVVGRFLMRFPMFARFLSWIREGYQRDREERIVLVIKEHLPDVLDKSMAFNGTGSFTEDMSRFYATVNAFMAESAADRRDLHRIVDQLRSGNE